MKKILFILSCIILTISCKSTKYDPNAHISSQTDEILDGIFQLRLGMSVEELKRVVDTTYLETNEMIDYRNNKKRGVLNGRNKYLYLKRYTPAYDHTLGNIILEFFDNKLYHMEIWTHDWDLESLLTSKYGISKYEEKKYNTIEWKTNAEKTDKWDTIKSKEKNVRIEKAWKTNSKDIVCESTRITSDKSSDYYKFRLVDNAMIDYIYNERDSLERKAKEEEMSKLGLEKKTKEQLLKEL